MFVGVDGFNETLASGLGASDTVLNVSGASGLCSKLGDNHTYLEITDGVYSEVVKATCTDGQINIVRENGRAFVGGACVRYRVTTKVVCEIVSQGGCESSEGCDPVAIGAQSIPSAVIGSEWVGVVAFSNATGIAVTEKPSWVTVAVSDGTAILKGTPPVGSASSALVVRGNGCNSVVLVHTSIEVCEAVS